MTTWTRDVLWWQVYPLGFTGAPIRPPAGQGADTDPTRPAPGLLRVEAWLDHVIELGLNGLALGPVFRSESHGYDTLDHFAIDPRLGTEGDFDRLVEAARGRGVRILLDGVFNHVGRAHPAFVQLERHGPDAETADMFHVDWDGWSPGDPVRAHVFEGHEQLVTLNHESEQVVDLVTSVMTHWLDKGVDGWRLDAAYAVPPRFWGRVLPTVRHRFPEAWFTGEVIHGDATAIVNASGLDSLTQYELWQAIWHSLADRNFYELAHALARHNDLLATFVPSTFVGNHDVTRIATAVTPALVPHALAVLLTVAGVPTIYSGDEYGFLAEKEQRLGGDDAVRPEFPDTPPSDADLDDLGRSTLQAHRELVSFRRRHRWLHRAHTDVALLDNEQVVLRTATADESVVTALSTSHEPTELPALDADTAVAGNGTLADGRVLLPPQGWAVLASRP